SPAVQESRVAKREIARNRNANASSANARSRAVAVVVNPVAANKAAVSRADDKADCPCINGRRKPSFVACYANVTCRKIRTLSQLSLHNLAVIDVFPPITNYKPLIPIRLLMTRLSGTFLGWQ